MLHMVYHLVYARSSILYPALFDWALTRLIDQVTIDETETPIWKSRCSQVAAHMGSRPVLFSTLTSTRLK